MTTETKSRPSLEIKRRLGFALFSAIIVIYLVGPVVSGWSITDIRTISGNIASIAFTLFGFVIAAMSILVAVRHRPLLETMVRTGHYGVLILTLFVTAAAMMLCGILAVASIFSPDEGVLLTSSVVALVFSILEMSMAGRRFYMTMLYL